MEQIRSADVLANFPQVDEEKLNAALAAEAAASNRKIIVLDDDPTGVQTVHDIYVYTDWMVESLRKGFAAPEKLFFILTNSRGFTEAETTKAHREIAENTAKVAREFGMDYLIIKMCIRDRGIMLHWCWIYALQFLLSWSLKHRCV